MNGRRIDAIARLLAVGVDRRRLTGGFAAALLGGLLPERVGAACKKPGRKCDKNRDCCDHAECKGGECKCKDGFKDCGGGICVDRDRDERHCGRCGNACSRLQVCDDGRCLSLLR